MRKLWFDLRESIGQAEEIVAGRVAGPTSEQLEPWLVLDATEGRLWFTPVDAPRPRSVTIAATHLDGPPPADGRWPLYRQPLTEPDPDHGSTLGRLRAAAQQGHRWLVADVSTSVRLHTAAAYDTDTAPPAAVWTPAWLAAADLGPYPGQVAHGYQHHGSVIARFTGETMARIAADAYARAIRYRQREANLLVLRDDGDGMEVFMVRAAGATTGDLACLDEVTAVGTPHVTVDPDGWYRLTDDPWCWRQAPLTLVPSRQAGERHDHGPGVFEANGPDSSRCTVCGATGYDIADEELPSMAGYGTDATIWCRICGSSDSYAEEIGWSSRQALWPPRHQPDEAGDRDHDRHRATGVDRGDSPGLAPVPPGGRLLCADETVDLLITGDHPDSHCGTLVVDAALIEAIRAGQVVACQLDDGQLAFTRAADDAAGSLPSPTGDEAAPRPGSTTEE